MKKITNFLIRHLDIILIIVLILLASPLRFIDLGYSDFHGDEHKAFIRLDENQSLWDFFMTRRKGPMQFLVAAIPYSFTHNLNDEFAQRLPFAIASVLAITVFYLFIKKFTGNRFVALLSAFLLMVNGFIAGFGRIAQYQNLNLLFSFLALYFYTNLIRKETNILRSSLLGTTFLSLSFLSHWDAFFTFPVLLYIFIKFLRNKNFDKKFKIKLLILNFVLGLLLVTPFFLPYLRSYTNSEKNQGYVGRRIGLDLEVFNTQMYKGLIELYNPFVTLWFLIALGIIGVLRIKKSWVFFVWFLFGYLIFELFVISPGTHIYNFVIPALILTALGVDLIVKIFPRYFKIIPLVLLTLVLVFLYYQTYMIFVDHSSEYPFEEKRLLTITSPIKTKEKGYRKPINKILLDFTAPAYNDLDPDYMRGSNLPYFGFTHARFWNEINAFVVEQNKLNGENFNYMTNEDKAISGRYMSVKYNIDGGFYAIGIKRPMTYVMDYNLSNVAGKKLVKTLRLNNENVVKIFRVEPSISR